MGWLWESQYERECREFHEKLAEVKRELKDARRDLEAIEAENKKRRGR